VLTKQRGKQPQVARAASRYRVGMKA
jgi:hypothetical protein